MSSPPALLVQGLTRTYGVGKRGIRDVSLRIDEGDIYGFLGPNGAGKTTAMRCILGLIRRDAGHVEIFGDSNPTSMRQRVGAIIETPAFHPWMSGWMNLEQSALYLGLPSHDVQAHVERVLQRVGLLERSRDPTANYSMGMRQRLGIARALLGQPRLLVLDEPTNGLDPKGMREVRDLVRSLAMHDGLTIFVSSHLLSEIQAIGTRVGILVEGELRAQGRVQDLLQRDGQHPRVRLSALDPAALKRCLAEQGGIDFVEEDSQGVLDVRVVAGSIPSLVRTLVEQGISLTSVVPQERSLEDAFLELTS